MINMSWEFGSLTSLRVFVFNYVLYSFGLILRYFFRFLHLGDAKKEPIDPPPQADGADWNRFHDTKIDGFPEELANFLFWSGDFHEGSEEREWETDCSAFMDTFPEGKTECSVLKETHSDIHEDRVKKEEDGIKEDGSVFMDSDSASFAVHEDGEENGGETKGFVPMETDSKVHEDGEKINEDETKSFVFMENNYNNMKKEEAAEEKEIGGPTTVEIDSDVHEVGRKIDGDETGNSVFMVNVPGNINEDGEEIDENETESSVLNEDVSAFLYDCKKIDEIETESSVLRGDGFNIHYDIKKEAEEETEDPVFVENDTVTTTSKYECLSGKDISGFMEEPTTLRFSFREFYTSPDVSSFSDNSYTNPGIVSNKVFSELDSEKDSVAQEEEEREESVHSNDIPFRFESEAFGGTDSSDEEDYFFFNENSVTSDSESESSCSSGLIWGNINKIDDIVSYQFLGGKNVSEGFESEILKLMMREERTEEGVEEKQSSCDEKVSEFGVHRVYSENGYIEIEPGMKDVNKKEGSHHEEMACRNGMEKTEEVRWEEELGESESDEDDFEWEHDDLVEQLKLELKNSRQGGLSTILEEEDGEEEEETKSPKVVEDLKPLKIEEKLEYKDQIDEIEKVYKSYAEKMRKLDILNYQTMHALGLVQLKDPLKLISIPKSTVQSAKPVIISQNLWPRKATKTTSDPLLKLVHELHRDLELVYVCQTCLSWEILCWQHKKALELQQYDSQGPHRYNHVAGEFQLFQVLLQRFIENEPFQGSHRIQNYVKNRCVIRNLLHVPAIKDDSKGGEEDAIASGRLVDIIKESMRVFWEFVRADKDYGNVILKVSKQIGSDLKDPAISCLLVDIRTQLQKKERKLKDIVRSGNCIVKKFQKHHEDQLDHEQLVAQVGLRLISRVVNMSHLRKEQVLWCNEKLHRIKFLSRKIVQVEPSFLLFPC